MQQGSSSNQQQQPGGDRRNYTGPERRTPKIGVDLSINIPTMISILVLIVSTSATGVGLYYNLDKRQMATDYAVANLTTRVEKAESSLTAIKVEQGASNDRLRTDVKEQLGEIKAQLDRLVFGGQPQPQRQLREWSR
jgi:hypothetical protein